MTGWRKLREESGAVRLCQRDPEQDNQHTSVCLMKQTVPSISCISQAFVKYFRGSSEAVLWHFSASSQGVLWYSQPLSSYLMKLALITLAAWPHD